MDNAKYPTEVASLQDLFFENSLVVTPSLIGGGYESSYTEANYQVVVTATVDGTQYTVVDTGSENEKKGMLNKTQIKDKVGVGSTVVYNGKTLTAM